MTGFESKREAAADKLQEPEREALKLALEALEWRHSGEPCESCNAALRAKERLIRIMGTFDLATGHADTFDELLDSLESELRDVLGHYRAAVKEHLTQEPVAFDAFLESEDFYELMQAYRHFPIDALVQFEAVKDALRTAHNVKERNFCPRCGKRTNDIHTCTPPKGAA